MNIHLSKHGSGFPLVFFHGWGFDSQIWKPLLPLLKTKYQLIMVDLPGFGLSPMMEWDEFKSQLLTLLPEQFALVGWSLGGLYATRLALEEPLHVAYLINITSSPCFLSGDRWPGVSPEVFSGFYQNLISNPRRTLEDFTQLQVNKTQLKLPLGDLPSSDGLKAGLEILGTWDFREQLKAIKPAVCYMFGRLDPIVPVKTMRVMQVIYPQFKYVFFNKAAHMPFLSHMDLFINELNGLIK